MFEVLMMGAGAPMALPGIWTQLALTGTKPSSRQYHTLVSVGDKLYLHGGTSGGKTNAELWEYDTLTNIWLLLEPSGSKPSARGYHTLTSVGDKLYLHGGGASANNRNGELWEYDVLTTHGQKSLPVKGRDLYRG